MINKKSSLHGLDMQGLLKLLNNTEKELLEAIKTPYTKYWITKNGKKRLIETPNKKLKILLQILCNIFQDEFECPDYNYYGYKGQNSYQNAKAHLGQFAYVTTDISHYFPSSKADYVQQFLENELNIEGKALEILLKMLTFEGHIPTGAPTSPILAFLIHKKIFDEINAKMFAKGIRFTLYADDITLSAKKGITKEEIFYIQSVLGRHRLKLKYSKTKHYSYKKALITGYYLHQSGKISVPNATGHSVIEKLNAKPINKMNLLEVQKLLGKINYIQQIDKKAFAVTRINAIKHLKKLLKTEGEFNHVQN